MREPPDILLSVEYLPVFKEGGQELKAHLSIKSTNGKATHNSVVVSNQNCLSRFPYGDAVLGNGCSPVCHVTVCFVLFYFSSLLYCLFVRIGLPVHPLPGYCERRCKFSNYFRNGKEKG